MFFNDWQNEDGNEKQTMKSKTIPKIAKQKTDGDVYEKNKCNIYNQSDKEK